MAGHAQRKRLDALQQRKRVVRAHACTKVTQPFSSGSHAERGGSELFGKHNAVVASVRLAHGRELVRRKPVEASAIDNHPAQRGAVAAEKFGDRVHHDVCTVLDRADEVRGGKRRIDHERETVSVSCVGNRLDVQHFDARVAKRLAVEELGVRSDRSNKCGRISRVDKGRGDTETGQRQIHHVVRPAVQVLRSNNVVTRAQQRGNGQVQRGGATGRAYRSHATFESSDAFLQYSHGRVGDAAVDVARRFEVEHRRGFIGVGERIRRGEIDWHRPRSGDRVRTLTSVQAERVEAKRVRFNHAAMVPP